MRNSKRKTCMKKRTKKSVSVERRFDNSKRKYKEDET